MRFLVVSCYKFVEVADPRSEVADHQAFAQGRDLTGRIYIADEGINAQFSGTPEAAQAYMEWLDDRFGGMEFKIQEHPEQAFPRMTIKVRRQLVALDQKIDTKRGGEYVSPTQWREMIESGDYLLVDVRNDYEWDVGHFKGSERPTCRTFREFPEYARQLKEQHDPKKTKVMMCCTGGIRCELYSVLMKDEGFEEVYQLNGGILRYSEQELGKYWDGKLFVFDDRLAVDVNPEAEVVGTCHHCNQPAEQYYNCANMDCNRLYLCCDACLEEHEGCCASACQTAERLRPLSHQNASKPFRRWYNYFPDKLPI
jgi:UPF0176 protein